VIATPQVLRRPLIVADPEPLSIAQMITAMRAGLGRRRGLIPVPGNILHAGFRLVGRGELYRRLAEPLVGDPARLLELGWVPRVTTSDALAVLARIQIIKLPPHVHNLVLIDRALLAARGDYSHSESL
jgi:UDP-glucose 4-epimerase